MPHPPERPTNSTPKRRSTPVVVRAGLHPRNRHQGRYDFAALAADSAELSAHLIITPRGDTSIDFGNAHAVRALNRALLKLQYGIVHWDIPDGYLCPPIPGRADYLHMLADLLAESNDGAVPRGTGIRVLDIGAGANCIYPLIGHRDYGWRFVGSEIDLTALRAARAIVQANRLDKVIELRQQVDLNCIFTGLLHHDDLFDITLCNPPFHASAEDAAHSHERKRRNLGDANPARAISSLNFGGASHELWCAGGEVAFVRRMIRESAEFATQALWFSSLIAKSEHLASIRQQLRKAGAQDVRVIAMGQGQKQSRCVAWTFLDTAQRAAWRVARWQR